MLKVFIVIFMMSSHLLANVGDEPHLKKMIARMLVVGFDQEKLTEKSQIIQEIQKYELGGVILFDRFYNDRNRTKNIRSPKQLQTLTHALQKAAKKPLLISIDQEGGRVERLKSSYGFEATPSALAIAKATLADATLSYTALAKLLHVNGINCNFAPVVDVAVNPKNYVIYGLERSYGSDVTHVSNYAGVFI
ncbi:MAG: glycoside hydrolase family 3 N-terminal domain-containing protein, partial [Campylobacterota bacterium]|nr:glycoside hydrolase family 3 N-terminal domain-containing protein [Campylobacterota bacterium]